MTADHAAGGHTAGGHTAGGHTADQHPGGGDAADQHPGGGHTADQHPGGGHTADQHPGGGDASGERPGAEQVAGGERLLGHPGQPGGAPRSLATRQAELVQALTSGNPVPPGFDAARVDAARVALLRKRAGEVAKQWPLLAAGLGDRWVREFTAWASARPTQGSARDGLDFARDLLARGALPAMAGEELAIYEATSRRGWAIRSAAGTVVVRIAGRVRVIRRARPAR